MVQKLNLPSRYKTISVHCKCGELLLRYKKGGKGRLRKIHRDRITEDYSGIFEGNTSPIGTNTLCPNCNQRIATIHLMNGKYVHKVNQGQLGIIKKS